MVFVPDDERDELDRAEGLGSGYEIWEVEAIGRDGDVRLAEVYVACASSIDPTLKPYDWYLSLIIDGAKARGLPESYIEALEKTEDRDPPGSGATRKNRPPDDRKC